MKRLMLVLAFSLSTTTGALAQNKKIVVTGMDPSAIKEMQGVASNVTIVAADQTKLAEQVADADAIFGTINPELFRSAKKLKWVQVYSAGVENYRFPEFLKSDVTLTNCKILQGPNIADHAFALLLALTRDLYRIIPNRTKEEWTRGKHTPIELRGKTAVIVGLGGIGMQIAQRAHAFDMKVIGVDPKDIPLSYWVSKQVPPDRLDSVLPEADVVFLAAPHTPQTEGLMSTKQFDLMKKNSYFIAVSRGKLYSSDALLNALESKHLAGAGLDVTNPEPLPKGHPLWKCENVIITPHIAGQSDNVQTRRMAVIKENIARFSKGEPLVNVVDKQKGY
jgi:phosphoglycerate dehydrogenase-like enzyme